MEENYIIRQATFNPKVKTYIFIVVMFYLIVSFIGLVVLPFWIFGLGQWLSNKFFNTLKCELGNKHLKFSKGFILHIEKTIPLENIQDLSFIGGPILRSFGLTMIKVETAGGGGAHQSNMMSMIGIENAEEFKNLILSQREKVIKEKTSGNTTTVNTSSASSDSILIDIKNELTQIKQILASKNL
ncbi:MAG: PH domain-containing protein [Bacteroidetes bacterium]|nr:PH domain-containing protein [Bacteroidota bacterium]